MISETQLKELLEQKAETKNVDYKESFDWNRATNDAKCEVVKDILSFLNTQDGGLIIFGVQDSTLELIGLGQDEFESFDPTKVNDFLHRYTDPKASCQVQKLIVDGRRVVVIGVPEFNDIPIICKKDANSSATKPKSILKDGGLYIRTDKATSGIVASVEEMRELLNRALLKRGDQLLNTLEGLFRGKPATNGSELSKYSKEVEGALKWFSEVLPTDFDKRGYWQLKAMPVTYSRSRIPDITTILKALTEASVSLRGWNFPHTDKETKSNFTDGRQSNTNFGRYTEAYRAYQSGLFVWRAAYREEESSFADKFGKALSFVNVIYEMTEFFVFLKRYYERIAPEATVSVTVELHDTMDRALVATDFDVVALSEDYVCHVAEIIIDNDYAVAELRATAEELAIMTVQKIFEVFNWNGPDPGYIRGWQQRLLSRTF